MAPIRPDHYDFAFDPDSLGAIRKRLGLTQAILAEQLDVPVNTVSRWETGATTPDAKALAAIFSIAKANGANPQFFKRRASLKQPQDQRTRLLFVWDFQNHALDASDIEDEWHYIHEYLKLRFPKACSNLSRWAYTALHQGQAAGELKRLGFEVYQGFFDADSQIIKDVQTACQDQPSNTVLVLVTDDGNFSELVSGLKQAGVDTYVLGTEECSERLRKSLGSGGVVPWDAPFVITECVQVIRELKGKAIGKAEFGNRCKSRLEEAEVYPGDAGYSKRNPYGSVLRWLEAQGMVTTTKVPGKPDSMTIKLVR